MLLQKLSDMEKHLFEISGQLKTGFDSLDQRLDAQLLSIQGTLLRGNSTILGDVEKWLQSLQIQLNASSSSTGDIESLRREIEMWRKQVPDPAFQGFSESVMTQLKEFVEAKKGDADGYVGFTKTLFEKIDSIQCDVSNIRDSVSSLTAAFSLFGVELRHQLENFNIKSVLSKLQEIENSVSAFSKEQEEEKEQLKVAVETLTEQISNCSKLGESTTELKNLLNAQTARLDVLIQDTHHVPTLMVLVPVVKKGLGKLNVFQDKARLIFYCSVTFEPVPCGKDGDGYEVNTLKPWVKKAIPVLKVGLFLLQLGLLASGVPIPVAALANAAIDQVGRNNF